MSVLDNMHATLSCANIDFIVLFVDFRFNNWEAVEKVTLDLLAQCVSKICQFSLNINAVIC